MRVQLSRLATLLAAALVAVEFTMVRKGNDFSVTATCSSAAPGSAVQICDDGGKIRVFKDVDDFVKAASKLSLITSASALAVSFSNPGAFEPPVFTGDIIKKNQGIIATYTANVARLVDTETLLTASIALMPSATPGEVAYKAEKQAQKDAVTAQKVWLTAEIARITALLPA